MHKSISAILRKYYKFSLLDWTTYIIGVLLIINAATLTVLEWYYKSLEEVEIYKELQYLLDAYKGTFTDEVKNLIYPNATQSFWGGSTYWFTFMTNVYLAITLAVFPFHKQSKKAQVMFFAAIVYITITFSMYWLSIALDPNEFTKLSLFAKIKSIIFHAVTPFIAMVLITLTRKHLRIDNVNIWALIIFPFFYYLFTLTIYFIGYKYKQNFGGSEIDRGIVIYVPVSFYQPLGYQGQSVYLIVIFNIILFLMAVLTAPIIGFIYRRVLRIRKTGQKSLPKLVYRRLIK
ncbi:MAGa3780 family membrane protein [Mycoplasmopsis columboralis]|uniref:Uncharacterized protein n=1 Tax=Mycoplasmopsis columboralis TaxID=171282 RepID=A0A449B606_9BACT|nr:hypothetical protein [Mycoplasmopsis columboralis]VEU76016.1 Uncharacterised protein [Mycoplasmopsis columboralis]